MNNTTDIHQTTEARRSQAVDRVAHLSGELSQLQRRRQEAVQAGESLNVQISQHERGGDAEVLAELRQARRDASDVQADLSRTIATVEEELRLAQGELRASTVMVESERYNAIQTRQAALLQTITEAVDAIVAAVNEKEQLAARQQAIHNGIVTGGNLNVAAIRLDLAHAITVRLQGHPAPALRTIDWSSRPMSEAGVLIQ